MPKEVDYNSLREKLNELNSETKESKYNPLKKEPEKSNYQTIRESLKRKDLGGRGTSEYMLRYLSEINRGLNKGNVEYVEGVARNMCQVLTSKVDPLPKEQKLKYLEAFNRRIERGLKKLEKLPHRQKNLEAMEKVLNYSKILEEDINNHSSSGLERKTLAILSIGSVLVGIFFLSPNLTGNVIGNMTRNSGNILGGILFILGIVGAFFTLRK